MKRFRSVILVVFLLIVSGSPVAGQKEIRDLKPTVLLISIDGFRSDYIERYRPKYLRKLAESGTRAKWMIPSFPTKTFPNHYTIATGLYPEHHGITDNNMYDEDFDAVFTLGKREEVQNGRWWQGEPIWVTAEKQGQTAGAFFFPGTETPIGGVSPTFWRGYDGDVPNSERVDTILSWLDLPVEKRPTILTMYFSEVDDAGHEFSPFSKEADKAVQNIDEIIGRLLNGLKNRKIRNKINLIIVSDHGMTPVPRKNQIVLDEMFDVEDAKKVFWVGEIVQIFPKPGREESIYTSIKSKLGDHAQIYRKNEIPERYRYRNHKRIPPILVLPDEGWVLTTREKFEEAKAKANFDSAGGSHGYDNRLESMRALFIGHGPAFKSRYLSEPFQNIEIYNLMCKILNLKPAPNDGDPARIANLLR